MEGDLESVVLCVFSPIYPTVYYALIYYIATFAMFAYINAILFS